MPRDRLFVSPGPGCTEVSSGHFHWLGVSRSLRPKLVELLFRELLKRRLLWQVTLRELKEVTRNRRLFQYEEPAPVDISDPTSEIGLTLQRALEREPPEVICAAQP